MDHKPLVDHLVHRVVEHALVFADAGFAGAAAGQGLDADPECPWSDPLRLYGLAHLGEGGAGAALLVRLPLSSNTFIGFTRFLSKF